MKEFPLRVIIAILLTAGGIQAAAACSGSGGEESNSGDWNSFKGDLVIYNTAGNRQDSFNIASAGTGEEECQNHLDNTAEDLAIVRDSPDAETNRLIDKMAEDRRMELEDCLDGGFSDTNSKFNTSDQTLVKQDWTAVMNRLREVAPADVQKTWEEG
ncbi:hypothetical protein OG689_42805 [Kitasatospora sp. NBC_00240]|uniref:hypothetical protein n=1 Tax=Kitasatospora sp. NBC_00240 TaxID=2903567 RepID=UPI002258A4E9|nr:hypothetical protein [Kitasatospora sp. NBC_00240]MCX5215878.1 hypothetical protein [Kitasatospora sp. NBC_00240]